MPQSKWNADEKLNEFIYDYFLKKNLHESASAFMREAKVYTDPVAIDVEGGFLYEWWSLFSDMFIAQTTKHHNEMAVDNQEIQRLKRQLLLQRGIIHSLHQPKIMAQKGITHCSFDSAANLVNPENPMQQSLANVMLTKHYEERRKQSQQGEGFDEPSNKKIGESPAKLLEANKAVLYKNALPSGSLVWNTGGNVSRPVQQCQGWPQSLPRNTQESLEMDFSAHKGSGFRHSSNHGSSNFVELEGCTLTDQIIPGLRQRQRPLSSKVQQHQNLSWQQQQTLPQENKLTALTEVQSVPSTIEIGCCHFSPDGMWLAVGGYDKKAFLWNVHTLEQKSTLEQHNARISDVRFSPDSSYFATSSYDSFVRVWDADNASNLVRSFDRHSNLVNSVDFYPRDGDILCSSSESGEICYWSVNKGSLISVSKGGKTQLRFQPKDGQYLAAVADNAVVLFDVQKNISVLSLQEYEKPVRSICWDDSGKYIASLTEDQARILSVTEGGKCIREFKSIDNKFQACVFHPKYPALLIIGCGKNFVLWNASLNKFMEVQAHSDFISALAKSNESGMIASASHDLHVKLWT